MQFLPLSTVLTSDLNISGNRVVDSADPEHSQDVATKHYVDNKFASKSGATMTGDLYFDGTLNRDVNLIANNIGDNRGFVVGIDRQFSYISFSKYANVNVCQIKCTTFQVFSNTGPILLAANIHGINMYKPLNLNSNAITNVKNPEHPQGVATKHYVDNRRCCNNVGLIPKLTANFGNRSGYIANASSEYNSNYQAYNAFSFSEIALNNGSNEWATANLLNNFWIKITLPVAKTIWKFKLTGRFATGAAYFNNWIFGGANANSGFTTLHTSNSIINTLTKEFILSPVPTTSYQHYRLFVIGCTAGFDPGLSYFQIFTLDEII